MKRVAMYLMVGALGLGAFFGASGVAAAEGKTAASPSHSIQAPETAVRVHHESWAHGIDRSPTGYWWDVHFWLIASDADLKNGAGPVVAGAGCAAALASLGAGIACGVVANYLITHVDPHWGNNHGVWVAVYPFPTPHITGGRW